MLQNQRTSHHPVRLMSLGVIAIIAGSLSLAPAHAGGEALAWEVDDPDLAWGLCPDFMPEDCGVAVLHGDPEQPNADIFFRLPGNSTADRHWHSSAERMVLVSGELHVGYDGQDPVVMRPGTYAYGPAELPHAAECRSADPCILFIAFEEPVDVMPGDAE